VVSLPVRSFVYWSPSIVDVDEFDARLGIDKSFLHIKRHPEFLLYDFNEPDQRQG
jgi:hypothetical protein